MRRLALLLAAALPYAFATGHGSLDVNQSRAYLLEKIRSSRPSTTDAALDCSWRNLAFSLAPKLLSQRLFASKAKELHDALELDSMCKTPFRPPPRPPTAEGTPPSPIVVCVSPSGSDTHSGALASPLRTLHAAVKAVRSRRAGTPPAQSPATISLRAGTYHLGDEGGALALHAGDSFLTFEGYAGEEASVSGAVLLDGLSWTSPPAAAAAHGSSSTTPGAHIATLTAAQAAGLDGKGIDGKGMRALRVDGRRATRARFPNANPELDLFPKGYILDKTRWLPPVYPPYNTIASQPCDPRRQCGVSTNLSIPAPPSEWHGMYQSYTQGYGGACEVYDPPRSPWCSGSFYLERQFPEMHTRSPAGIAAAPHLPHGPYADVRGAHIFAWRPHHWYSWMWEVGRGRKPPHHPIPTPEGAACSTLWL